jgi:hypothetical protein
MSNRDKITFDVLYIKYVPQEGKAYTVAGELLRATARIYNRYYNDGDMINKGYGKETCNKPAHYLWTMAGAKVKKIIDKMKDSDCNYEEHLEMLITEVVNCIKTSPELETEYNSWDSFIDEDWESDWIEDKLITITISDGTEEYAIDFMMENVSDFEDVVNRIKEDLDIY